VSIKLITALPKEHRRNGLANLDEDDLADKPRSVTIVGRLSVKAVERIFESATEVFEGPDTVVRLGFVELEVVDGLDLALVEEVIARTRQARTGEAELFTADGEDEDEEDRE
jgi:hypothetical protein